MRLHTTLNVKYRQPGYSLVAGVGEVSAVQDE